MPIGIEKDAEQGYLTGSPNSTTIWEKIDFGFISGGIKIKIEGTGNLEWSWDGKEVHGILANGEKEDFINFRKGTIFIRGAATVSAKIWAWI